MFLSIVKDTDFDSNKYLRFVRWIVLNFSVKLKFADNFSTGNFSENNSLFTAWKRDTGKARGPLLKEGNSVALLSKEMLCYDWSKQQHSVSEQIKTQHLF